MKTPNSAWNAAVEQFSSCSVDVELALETLAATPISLHCWQGDDVRGFEATCEAIGGGLAVTGTHPGAARNVDELRSHLDVALSLIPGRHRLNLHASYGEFGGRAIDRDAIELAHFRGWIDWARSRHLGLDFNPTCFAHRLAADGSTLSHPDAAVREFWLEHAARCRLIGAAMGKSLGSACVVNLWIPDGSKEVPVDRAAPRDRLREMLDRLYAFPADPATLIDSVESKLFGLGSESYVVGSHEFYLTYALRKSLWLCLDLGHFHPTEVVADKLSAILPYLPGVLLHVSRGVRWDSDHVVIGNDEVRGLMQELVRGSHLPRVRIGLDYFDASINRIAAWVVGARATQIALLAALLEPTAQLRELEQSGNLTARLALLEDCRLLPVGVVWTEFCRRHNVPAQSSWLTAARQFERID